MIDGSQLDSQEHFRLAGVGGFYKNPMERILSRLLVNLLEATECPRVPRIIMGLAYVACVLYLIAL